MYSWLKLSLSDKKLYNNDIDGVKSTLVSTDGTRHDVGNITINTGYSFPKTAYVTAVAHFLEISGFISFYVRDSNNVTMFYGQINCEHLGYSAKKYFILPKGCTLYFDYIQSAADISLTVYY